MFKEFDIQFNYKKDIENRYDELVDIVTDITYSAINIDPSTGKLREKRFDKQKTRVRVGNRLNNAEICTIVKHKEEYISSTTFKILSLKDGQRILYGDAGMVRPPFQGKGVMFYSLKTATERIDHDFLVLRTQNPIAVLSVRKIYPNFNVYEPSKPIHREILSKIAESLQETLETNIETGIFRPKKSEGILQRYTVKNKNKAKEIYSLFEEHISYENNERLYFIAESKT